jgi:hypothetical protein
MWNCRFRHLYIKALHLAGLRVVHVARKSTVVRLRTCLIPTFRPHVAERLLSAQWMVLRPQYSGGAGAFQAALWISQLSSPVASAKKHSACSFISVALPSAFCCFPQVRFTSLSGYCLMKRSHPHDSSWLAVLTRSAEAPATAGCALPLALPTFPPCIVLQMVGITKSPFLTVSIV